MVTQLTEEIASLFLRFLNFNCDRLTERVREYIALFSENVVRDSGVLKKTMDS